MQHFENRNVSYYNGTDFFHDGIDWLILKAATKTHRFVSAGGFFLF